MNITLKINGIEHVIEAPASTTLLAALRGLGFHGVKFGDEQGLTGADTVLLDGKPVNAGSMLAAQAEGHAVATIEALEKVAQSEAVVVLGSQSALENSKAGLKVTKVA